ncbi:MAG: hypothetical protein K2Z80_07500 [Xanthobacteraceae bacterium]|nr:hypothetical protein [Xanthobacteraceae bacterium]
MKMVAEYLEKALSFEQLAQKEADLKLKTNLLNQAAAYRKLASERALQGKLLPVQRSRS